MLRSSLVGITDSAAFFNASQMFVNFDIKKITYLGTEDFSIEHILHIVRMSVLLVYYSMYLLPNIRRTMTCLNKTE